MSRLKKILIAVLAVAVLVGGYFAVSHFLSDDKNNGDAVTGKTDESGEAVETEKAVTIPGIVSEDKVTGISYVYGEETVNLVKKDGKWYLKSDMSFPVKSTYPDAMLSAAANLTAKRLITDNPDDFSEYGLREVSAVYSFTLSDKSTVTYMIGDFNSFSDGYYLNINGRNEAFLIDSSFIDNFMYGVSDLADVEKLPELEHYDIKSFDVAAGDTSFGASFAEGGSDKIYTDMYEWFLKSDNRPLDSTKTEDLLRKLLNFSQTGCASHKVTADEMKKFGLDKPQAKITFDYEYETKNETGKLDDEGNEIYDTENVKGTLTITLGGMSNDGGSCYAKSGDSDIVYLLDSDYLDNVLDASFTQLLPMDVCLVDIESIDAMDVTVDGKEHKILIVRSKNENGADVVNYSLDGSMITATDAYNFYASIQGMIADDTTETPKDGEAYLKVVYHRNTSAYKTMTVEFVPYDSNFYLVRFNGAENLLVNKRDVENAVDTFNSIKKY